MAVLFTAPFVTALNLSGLPIAGATLTFYATGTSTLATVYADNALSTPLANPIAADVSGRFPAIYLGTATYRAVLKDASGSIIRDTDPLNSNTVISYTAPGTGSVSRALAATLADVRQFAVKDYSGVADAAISATGAVTSGTDNYSAFIAAQAAGVATGRPFTIVFDAGNWLNRTPYPFVNGQTVVMRDGARCYGYFPTPTGAKGHQQIAVFCMAGVETDANYTTAPGGTGDYCVSTPRQVDTSNATTILPGATSFTAINAGQVFDVVSGSWLQMGCAYVSNWHPIFSEYAQVASVSGATVTFQTPLRFGYDNLDTGVAAFCQTYKRTQNPTAGVNLSAFPRAGFRRFTPLTNVKLVGEGDARIACLSDASSSGYAPGFAVFAWAAIDMVVRGVRFGGGGFWALDCQDVLVDRVTTDARVGTALNAEAAWLFNGSNRVKIINPRIVNSNIFLEEHCESVTITTPDLVNSKIFIKAGTRNCVVTGGGGNFTGNVIDVGQGDYEFGNVGTVLADVYVTGVGSALCQYTLPLLACHPHIAPAMIAAVEPWYRGNQLLVRGGRYVASQGPGAEFYVAQRVRAENVELGFTPGANIASPVGVTSVIGTVRRAVDGARVGYLTSAALPTFVASGLGDEAWKTDGTQRYSCVNFRKDTVNTQVSTTILTVNNFGSNGGYAVGDVVRVLVSSGTTVIAQAGAFTAGSNICTVASTTGMVAGMAVTSGPILPGCTLVAVTNGTTFTMSQNASFSLTLAGAEFVTVGNINKDHVAVVTAVNSGTSQITLGTAIPTGFLAYTATGGYIETSRWA